MNSEMVYLEAKNRAFNLSRNLALVRCKRWCRVFDHFRRNEKRGISLKVFLFSKHFRVEKPEQPGFPCNLSRLRVKATTTVARQLHKTRISLVVLRATSTARVNFSSNVRIQL